MTKKHVRWIAAACLVLFMAPAGWAMQVRIGYTGLTAGQSVLWVTQESGLFKQNGLDVETILFPGGSLGIAAMAAGDVPIIQSVGPEVIHGFLNGLDTVIVAVIMPRLAMALVTVPEITSPDQLIGKKVAVSRLGSLSDGALRLALEKFGSNSDNVTVLQLGSAPNRLAALERKVIDGTILTADMALAAKKRNLRVLIDFTKIDLPFPQTGLSTTRKYIRQHPETTRKVVKAYVEGVRYFLANKDRSVAIIAKHMQINPSVASEMYELTKGLVTPMPYPTPDGVQNMIRVLAKQNPAAQGVRAEQLIDPSFVRELDPSSPTRP